MTKEMHHLVIGDDNFEVVDNASREKLLQHDDLIAAKANSADLDVERERIDEADETISEHTNKLDDLETTIDNKKILVVNAALGTLTFNSNGAAGGTIDVSQYIPEGYSMIAAIPAATGYFGCYFYFCAAASANSVMIQLMRVSGTQATTQPVVKLLCVMNL